MAVIRGMLLDWSDCEGARRSSGLSGSGPCWSQGCLGGAGKMRRHLLALSTGMRVCSYERVHFRDLRQRLAKVSEGAATAARRGHKGPNA